MATKIALTDAEYAALAAVDGSREQLPIPLEIKARLTELYLIERRAWPNGPLWQSAAGRRRVRQGK